jgi:hypothetical protein
VWRDAAASGALVALLAVLWGRLAPPVAAVPVPALKLLSAAGVALPPAAAAAALPLYRRHRSSLLLVSHVLLLLGGLPQVLFAHLVASGWLPAAGAGAVAATALMFAQQPRASLSWIPLAWQAAALLLQLAAAQPGPSGVWAATLLQLAAIALVSAAAWRAEMADRCGAAPWHARLALVLAAILL